MASELFRKKHGTAFTVPCSNSYSVMLSAVRLESCYLLQEIQLYPESIV